YDFENYFKLKFKLEKKHVKWIQCSFFIIIFSFIGLQALILKKISLEGTLLGLILIFLCIRVTNHIIFLQFKDYSTYVETIGYFVINELLVILETSQSLKEATRFIISSNYPVYSNIFQDAILLTHFGNSLVTTLIGQLEKNLKGDICRILINILKNWEHGKNITLVSKNRILDKISEKIVEETDKIDTWASISSGILYLCPPVILCFLLISGNMNSFFGILITLGILIGSYFISPEKNMALFSLNNQLILSYNNESVEFLIILSDNLCKGYSFVKSLNNALCTIKNEDKRITSLENAKYYANFKLGLTQESENDFLRNLFPERTVRLLSLTKKFSMVSTSVAGEKLLVITREISKTNQILKKGVAEFKAAQFHRNIIQLLSIISLGFITGASSFFIFVSDMISHSITESISINRNLSIEITYFLIAMVMCFSPIRNMDLGERLSHYNDLWRIMTKTSKFMLFLTVYVLTSYLFQDFF
ncbi:MAG: hypothetical protein ACFFAU_17275, partial [Candidatus Hodarchaeota archaeon]